jgi:hypothetical protein
MAQLGLGVEQVGGDEHAANGRMERMDGVDVARAYALRPHAPNTDRARPSCDFITQVCQNWWARLEGVASEKWEAHDILFSAFAARCCGGEGGAPRPT